jgi:DNA-binding NtrC family response regulator
MMKRILLVGQDPQVCHSVAGTLTGLGFGIDVACDRRTGLFLADRRDYTHLVVDDEIDEGGGLAVFRQLNILQKGVTGILLTAAGNHNTVASAMEAGVRRVLAKPVDHRQLISIIATAPMSPTAIPVSRVSIRSVASLSIREIHETLSVEQLISIIRMVDYPFAGKERLEHFDRDTLERVVHLVCRWCRQKLATRTAPAPQPTATVRHLRAHDAPCEQLLAPTA